MARGGSAAAGSTMGRRGTRSRPIGTSVPFQRRSCCSDLAALPVVVRTTCARHVGRCREAGQRERRPWSTPVAMDWRTVTAQAAVRRAVAAQDLRGGQRALGGHLERVAEARRVGTGGGRRAGRTTGAGRELDPAARRPRASGQRLRRGHDRVDVRDRPGGLDHVDLGRPRRPRRGPRPPRVEEPRVSHGTRARTARAGRTGSGRERTSPGPSAASSPATASARSRPARDEDRRRPSLDASVGPRRARTGARGAAPDRPDGGSRERRSAAPAADDEVDVGGDVSGRQAREPRRRRLEADERVVAPGAQVRGERLQPEGRATRRARRREEAARTTTPAAGLVRGPADRLRSGRRRPRRRAPPAPARPAAVVAGPSWSTRRPESRAPVSRAPAAAARRSPRRHSRGRGPLSPRRPPGSEPARTRAGSAAPAHDRPSSGFRRADRHERIPQGKGARTKGPSPLRGDGLRNSETGANGD